MRAFAFVAFASITLLFAGGDAYAQPALDDPPEIEIVVPSAEEVPLPNDRRGQRRERLRRLGSQIFEQFLDPAEAGDAPPAEPLDLRRLNVAFDAIAERLVTRHGLFESLHIEFVPGETDLERDAVQLEAAGLLDHTAWSDRPTDASLSVNAKIVGQGGPDAEARVSGRLRMATDVVALADYALPLLMGLTDANSSDELTDPDQIAEAGIREMIERHGPIRSLDDLGDLFPAMAEIRLAAYNTEVERLKFAVAEAGDDAAWRAAQDLLIDARSRRDELFKVHLQIHRDDAGDARLVRVIIDDPTGSPSRPAGSTVLEFTPEEFTAEFDTRFSQGLELYSLFKPLAMGTLRGLANRDPQTVGQVNGLIDGAAPGARVYLQGEER